MIDKAKEIIAHHQEKDALFVLKGFDPIAFGVEKNNLKNSIDNKLARLFQITQQDNRVICFDEFVCLYDLVMLQFKKVYILENGIFWNLYPVNTLIENKISSQLLAHFDPNADENEDIRDISEYIQIYSNYIITEQGIACCYNIEDSLLKSEKITRIPIGNPGDSLEPVSGEMNEKYYLNLCNDTDYFQLVMDLINTSKQFAITWESFITGKQAAQRHIEVLNGCFPNRLFSYLVPSGSEFSISRPEIFTILNKYWGYSSFRNIKMYDLGAVEKRNKKVISISQEQIISDLVEQVENCISGKGFKDIFVTAPTGAGKSLIFQIPAIYLAEKYNLVTLVITPLIGLMNDQVQALKKRGYAGARTINSDISPIIKQDILEEVANGACHILYLSPESLLSRSDIEQLIGSRRIGMLVVDEAHIVTTWGKQFRPDYWYLGDHVQSLRRTQAKREPNPSPFIIATFTATAIYEGNEDMYHETLNSLHMIDPITYLGYVKRDNILIDISEVEVKTNKTEYEINKFDSLITMIQTALMRGQKTLIYFPTVALIDRFHDYCYSKDLSSYIAKYHGQMEATQKNENFLDFKNGKKLIMLATKAFGMGIDIPDITNVSHFAPTGNVCDYMQEIGRVARDEKIKGHAIYQHMSNDFKHINRLHGLSAIQKYQLVEVIKKILEIYTNTRYKNSGHQLTKKRNEMLVDAESFAYIFESPQSDENDLINKVKTAMLLIQKDYENRGFSPFYMRPIPLFAYGYFSLSPKIQEQLNERYPNSSKLVYHEMNICEINLKEIWDRTYSQQMSFPKFKFLLYSKSKDLSLNQKYNFVSAMSVEVYFEDNNDIKFQTILDAVKEATHQSMYKGQYLYMNELIELISGKAKISPYKAESIMGVVLAAMDIYRRDYSGRMNSHLYNTRATKDGKISYHFSTASGGFFAWLIKGYQYVVENTQNSHMYVVNEVKSNHCRELTTILGLLESFGVLRFKSLGGSNSQIYIYVNETKNMQIVRDKPGKYKNKLLELINARHQESVKMLTFLFQNGFSSDEVWEHLENYFLGILPPGMPGLQESAILPDEVEGISVQFQIGDSFKSDYTNWHEAVALFDNQIIDQFSNHVIPLADYYAAKLIIGDVEAYVVLAWFEQKIALTNGEESDQFRALANENGWLCLPIDSVSISDISARF